MYLKKIEIAGFKSFADRTVIDFENSVTAVVGPNGSGKSNITEAIRWVLGEQSAKSLRGGKMPDIIFAGSDSRKALNIAEVTVVLDNSDHYLPLDYSEISVTRRLHRNGDSDFYINKQSCRLKDIQDLFMDSGLGKESFSIISQGKVEAIFASKPEDRRGIFEEAAGVLKYKQRKKKAEQKLFETEDNLSRVQDIVYELEDQLTPLKEQSHAAKEFLRLKEELKCIDVAHTVTEIKLAKSTWDQAEENLQQLNRDLQNLTRKMTAAENKLQTKRQKRQELDQWLETANQQLLFLTESLKQAEGQQEVLLERSKHTKRSFSEYEENLAENQAKIEQLEAAKQALIQELSTKNGQVQNLEANVATLKEELTRLQKSTKELLEELRSQYVEKMQEHANIGNDLKYLERQYLQENAKNQKTITKQGELHNQIASLSVQKTTFEEKLAEAKKTLVEQRNTYILVQQQAQKLQQEFETEQKKMYSLMQQVQQVRAKQKSLQDIQDNYSGFYQGVKMVLQNKEQLTGIVGAVAELIQVPTEYTLAIETALGGAAQHIVVENEGNARQAITFLKERRGGRATFLPLTTIKDRHVSDAVVNMASKNKGFLGVASQLVKVAEKLQPISDNLLGTTLIAQDLTSANEIARDIQFRYRVVSLEGDVMNAGGSMTGGATKRGNQGSLFSQTNELQNLTAELQMLDTRLQATEKQVQLIETRTKEKNTELEQLRNSGESARLKEQELTNQVQNILQELQRLEKEQKVFAYENREVQQFLTEYEEQKADLIAKQAQVDSQRESINHEIQQLTQQEDVIEAKRQAASTALATKQAELAVACEKVSNLKQTLATTEATLKEAQNRQESLSRQMTALNSNSSDHELSEEALQKKVSELSQKKMNLETELTLKRQERNQLQQVITDADEEVTQLNGTQKTLLSQKTKEEVAKNRADIHLDNLLVYLQEEYSITFELAVKEYTEISDSQQAKSEIQRYKREIERLGPVNLNAIEQYEQVSGRHTFLTSQRDDLLAAKDQLFKTMDEMDEEVKVRFGEIFEAIRLRFKDVFPQMFGGGRAELLLTDPTDLLNTGIEIEAQPPGKKLQNLSLLSGGERALTAIALLFSIIQVRPVPFCVLDEVEAALDEANVTRFGSYLSRFQDDTQFIVVTHRKGTMEAANVLYGVTMQESGISKIVSVRLEDVSEGGKIKTEA
ncbi:chromosome partition protein Smc [Enterococcus saigonensis]|uniref:Chromosome partition protein Smc n=1 Tax=Enterococcus saigonensis TaxID=1805431 RepID=A0A679IEI2_9ENTE|nr:chromosome segregation protein SMC [Enterococcus saigonensis]BCA86740.1 chromosome partition protein Smc [Enterococcus saigonensis]